MMFRAIFAQPNTVHVHNGPFFCQIFNPKFGILMVKFLFDYEIWYHLWHLRVWSEKRLS